MDLRAQVLANAEEIAELKAQLTSQKHSMVHLREKVDRLRGVVLRQSVLHPAGKDWVRGSRLKAPRKPKAFEIWK